MKRIMIAGTSSGSGKTTITCAILRALKNRGYDVTSFKCGPDYIDPMFHRRVTGTPSYNLDSFMMDRNTINYLLKRNGGEVSVIEGVMGFYDGLGFTETGSSHELSKITLTPVILVINCGGMSLSAPACVKGFTEFRENNIKGVIFNNLHERLYEDMARECEKIGIVPLGFMPRIEKAKIESRHLGLVKADEITDLDKKIELLANQAEKSIDLDTLLKVSDCGDTKCEDIIIPRVGDVKIAVARDSAFCFYYEDNLSLLRDMGAQIIEFSPLKNEPVPECDGLILGGGYPELYARQLEKNTVTLRSVKEYIKVGTPCIAECGGFMYLHKTMEDTEGTEHKMAGVIDGACHKTDRPQRFGYMEMTANIDNILCRKGDKIRAREFHYFDSTSCGDAFTARKRGRSWQCTHADGNLFAGFGHIHFWANINFAKNFIESCEKYKCTR